MEQYPFQSTYVTRCSMFRKILSCCGLCNDCCYVVGFPIKNQGHVQRSPRCYWLIWLLVLLALPFGVGYGISWYFNSKKQSARVPTNQNILNSSIPLTPNPKQVISESKTNITQQIFPTRTQKQPEIVAPIVSTDIVQAKKEPKPVEVVNPIVSTDTTTTTTTYTTHPSFGQQSHPRPENVETFVQPVQQTITQQKVHPIHPINIVETKIIQERRPMFKPSAQVGLVVVPWLKRRRDNQMRQIMLMKDKRYRDFIKYGKYRYYPWPTKFLKRQIIIDKGKPKLIIISQVKKTPLINTTFKSLISAKPILNKTQKLVFIKKIENKVPPHNINSSKLNSKLILVTKPSILKRVNMTIPSIKSSFPVLPVRKPIIKSKVTPFVRLSNKTLVRVPGSKKTIAQILKQMKEKQIQRQKVRALIALRTRALWNLRRRLQLKSQIKAKAIHKIWSLQRKRIKIIRKPTRINSLNKRISGRKLWNTKPKVIKR